MRIGAVTSVGQVRSLNEDAYWYNDSILVVCDGMGGHQAGEVASSLAIDTIQNFPFVGIAPEDEVVTAIELAHQRIQKQAASNNGYRGMGTTLTMAFVIGTPSQTRMILGHVGDSRAYLVRDGHIFQLTKDHSVVGELMRSGSVTLEEAESHPQRHVLTQALGAGTIHVDVSSLAVQANDRIILCSDGLTAMVGDQEILSTLNSLEPLPAANHLMQLANDRGGPDNITLIVAYFP